MSISVFEMEVHPAAAAFPMLLPDELAELAQDIKENGLAHPIVVKDGVLIDGRNRREACRIAGVAPEVIELNGQDPIAYILSSNINRRHMTKGQRAMCVAMIQPEGQQGKRGTSLISNEVSGGYVRQARTVLRWAPELVQNVLSGAVSLDAAYEDAKDRKLKSEAPQKRLEALRAKDADLADKVVEGDLVLEDAESAANGRRERERAARQGIYDGFTRLDGAVRMFSEGKNLDFVIDVAKNYQNEISKEQLLSSIGEWISILNTAQKALKGGK